VLKANKLKCDNMKCPIGIDEKTPIFSWTIESDRSNLVQKTYRIQVATDDKFSRIVWDSGTTVSKESVCVEYRGDELKPTTRYYFRVMITDNQGFTSPWSNIAYFETGFMKKLKWRGQFISPETEEDSKNSEGRYVRREFVCKERIASVRAYVTALGLYELYINGIRVVDAFFMPGHTNYEKRLLYQTYDITQLINVGSNAIGAVLGSGWYKGDLSWLRKRNLYGKATALLLEVHIQYSNGSCEIICSDAHWKAHKSPILYSEIYHGETYDARKEITGWNLPNFNDVGWRPVSIVQHEKSIICAQDGPLVTKHEHLRPKNILTTPKGEKIIDFGQNITGWLSFKVVGNRGDRIVIKHAETLDSDGNFYTENLRSAKQRIEYILKGGGQEHYEPHFTYQGFRYVLIEEYPGEIVLEHFRAIVMHSNMKKTGDFSCSDERINQLHSNILWSMRDNFLDIPTDCPQRDERLGWTGDAQIFINTASYLMDISNFFRKWLRDLASDQKQDGEIPFVVPDILKYLENTTFEGTSAGWGDAAVICPWVLYQMYGNEHRLLEQYESMKAWVEYIRKNAAEEVLWEKGNHLGDWVALDSKEGSYIGATPKDLIATAYYAYSTNILMQAAKTLHKEEDMFEYAVLYKKIREAYINKFFTLNGRLNARTQTAHIISLVFQLTPDEFKKRTIDTLVELLHENNWHLNTGFIGTPYLCYALSQNGQIDVAYRLLFQEDYPSWLYQISKGATTIWEHWDGLKPDGTMWSSDSNSFNHYAYGAIGSWLYEEVAGLKIERDKIIVNPKPHFGFLSKAKAEQITPYGKASVSWEFVNETSININITVPHNTIAYVRLQFTAANEIQSLQGVEFLDSKEGTTACLGSGEYCFKSNYNKRRMLDHKI